MTTLVERLRRAAGRHGDRVAVVGPDRTLRYAELADLAGRAAAALAALGVGPGDRVAVAEPKSAALIAAVYGVLELGAAYVPIDLRWPARRAEAVCRARRIKAAVAPERWRGALPGASAAELIDKQGRAPEIEVAPETIAYILHTSGSTGAPRGVPLSHANAGFFIDAAVERWSITAGDRLAAQAPLSFDLSVFDLYVAAAAGAAVVLIPERFGGFPKKMTELIEREAITVWNSVVSTLLLLSERGGLSERDVSSLRLVLFSGEPMPPAGLERLRGQLPDARFFNVYGQTEANSSLCFPVDELEPAARSVPIGKPLPGFDVFAVDGELFVRAPTVGEGYLDDPEQTAARYVADPRDPGSGAIVYRTGDRVELDGRGNFVFAGRADNLVKTRGHRVELGEIERAMAAIDGVERAVAVAVPDPLIGHRIAGFACPRPGHVLEAAAIAAALAVDLPGYMIPEPIEIREALPATATGKIDRQRLISDLLRDTTES